MSLTKRTKGLFIGGAALILLAGGGFYAYQTVGYSLSEKEAQTIAYGNAGITAKDVIYSKIEKEREGLKATYELDFHTATTEYSYTIDAKTGSILDRESEGNGFSASSSSASSSNSTAPSVSSSNAGSSSTASGISSDDAKSRALNDAGLIEASVTNLIIKASTDDGLAVYEVDFIDPATHLEYDYTINATTGDILEKSSEPVND